MSTAKELIDTMLAQEIAPKHYESGYIALSFFISVVGSISTLELLQRRTSGRGLYNWYLLIGSAVTMGGIAIWSMHFVGNRATVLYNGEPEKQLQYSGTYTSLSFFVPIFVLLGAYSLAGPGHEVGKLRVGFGGLFAGSSICGMHYLGNAGISNFRPSYSTPYVVGAVVVAVISTIVALTLFFLMKKNFTNSWWKRVCIGFILATGVSAMHWIACCIAVRIGTTYHFKRELLLAENSFSQKYIVIIVIVLSVVCCLALLTFAVAAGRQGLNNHRRAQRIVLASVIFDDGKLMVLPDGSLPIKTITDTFTERSFEESFGKRHPVFQWAYRTSRAWVCVVDLLPAMRQHLRVSQQQEFSAREEYSVLFQEMFCMAAKDLADATHLSLESVGVLHEEIINTGGMNLVSKIDPEIGSENRGRGKVLFLVKHISHSEAARLGAFGFRFTTPSNVYDVLSRTMEVSKTEITKAIKDMSALQPDRESLHDEGVYIGCFAVKPEVVKGGFDILVQDASTSRIPTRSIGIPSFSAPHYRFLKKIHGKTAGEIVSFPSNIVDAAETSGLTETFAVHFTEAVSLLLGDLKDNYFANAVLDTNPQYIPTTGSISQLIVFKIMVPIHVSLSTPGLTFTPFLFFSTQQRSYPGCSEHEVHVRRVHREFSGRATPTSVGPRGTSLAKRMFKDRDPLKLAAIGRSMASSSRSPSVSSEKHLVIDDRFLSAGIMVSQSVTVEVAKEQANSTDTRPLGPSVDVMKLDETSDVLTWCEVLFKGVIEDMKIRDTTR